MAACEVVDRARRVQEIVFLAWTEQGATTIQTNGISNLIPRLIRWCFWVFQVKE
jgi:hypothetical protein